MKHSLLAVLLSISSLSLFAQVDIDRSINLSGTGANAKVSGIKSVTAAQDAVSAEVLQKGALVYAAAAGTNTYTLTLAPALTAPLAAGTVINFRVTNANTGAATLNVNGTGAVSIKKDVNIDLEAGDLAAGQAVSVIYDGTNFQLISRTTSVSGGSNNYIQNQVTTDQAAGFRVNGNGLFNGGQVGIGTATPAGDLWFGGNTARTIGMDNRTTAGNGFNLSVTAGGYGTGTNRAGGSLNLSAGQSTGTGISTISFLTSSAGTSGSTPNVQDEKMRIHGTGVYVIDRMGVGVDVSTSTALNVRHNIDGNGSRFGIDTRQTITDVPLTANRTHYGIYNNLINQNITLDGFSLTQYASVNDLSQNTAGANITNAHGALNRVNNTNGTITTAYGAYNTLVNSSNGTVTTGYGALNYSNNAGTITTSYGAFNQTNNSLTMTSGFGAYNYFSQSAGTATDARGTYSRMRVTGGTVTNAYGIQNAMERTAGTVTNAYGVYTSFSGTFGTKWGIYNTGEDKNYFSGDVGIGTTTPAQMLNVVGNAQIDQASGSNSGSVIYKNPYQTNTDWRLVYRFDFETGTDGFVVNTTQAGTTNATVTGSIGRQAVSGGMGSGNFILSNCCSSSNTRNPVFKKLIDLANSPHSEVKIKVNYFFIDSWDGGNERGWFGIAPSQGSVPTLIWSKHHDQDWSGDSHWHGSSSYGEVSCIGEGQINNSSSSFWLHIGSNLDDNPSDESMGIDNIEVWIR